MKPIINTTTTTNLAALTQGAIYSIQFIYDGVILKLPAIQ